MAHKTGSGSSKNGRDSISKRLGIKLNILNFFLCFFIIQKINYFLSIFNFLFTEQLLRKIMFFNKKNENNFLKHLIFIKTLIIKNDFFYIFKNITYYNSNLLNQKFIKNFNFFFTIIKKNKLFWNNYPYNVLNKNVSFSLKHFLFFSCIILYIFFKKNRFYRSIYFKFGIYIIFLKILDIFLIFKNEGKIEKIIDFLEKFEIEKLEQNIEFNIFTIDLNKIYNLFFIKNLEILKILLYSRFFIYII